MIALKGLLLQAQKQGDIQEATKLAERAYEINPNAPWIVPVLADVYRHGKAWGKARKMLEESLKRKTALSKEQNRMLGILLLSEAEERLRMGDADAALNLSYRANKLVPGFAPAAVLLAAILLKLGKKRKAAHMLEQHWETMPHPDLAKAYIALYADEPVEKQLKHVEKLASAYPDHSESHRIVAKYALMADDYTKARTHLKALLQIHPTVSAYKMMYELEKRENRPSAEVLQSWVEKAAHADQDAAWVCRECGYSTKAGWSQHCNNCDTFDSYQWKEASSVHLLKTPVVTALQN
jgi:HemY protein